MPLTVDMEAVSYRYAQVLLQNIYGSFIIHLISVIRHNNIWQSRFLAYRSCFLGRIVLGNIHS